MYKINQITKVIALTMSIAILFSSCMSVPALVTADQYRAQYVGQPLTTLINEFGLPTNEQEQDDGGKICTWEMGVETSSVGLYHGYGVSSGSSQSKAQRMTAYADANGVITDLRSSGFQLGNIEEVQVAKRTNTYLGFIYGSTLLSMLLLLSI